MKAKKVLIAVAILLLAAGVLGVIGMSNLNWDFKNLDNTKYVEQNYVAAEEENVRSVNLNTVLPVSVRSGDELTLKYYDIDDHATELTLQDGVLTLNDRHRDAWYKFFRFHRRKIELTLPAGTDLAIDATNLDLDVADQDLGDIRIDSVNLKLNFRNCTLGDLDIDSANLSLGLTESTAGVLRVASVNTDARLAGSTFASIAFDTTNLTLRGEPLDVPVIDLDATNINIRVKLSAPQSEYNISTDTINGRPPASQSGSDPAKTIRVDTVNWSGFLAFA